MFHARRQVFIEAVYGRAALALDRVSVSVFLFDDAQCLMECTITAVVIWESRVSPSRSPSLRV
jgi:hypothetical protein